MPTERLSDENKIEITRSISNVTRRALFNKKFPIDKSDFFEWMCDQLPKAQRKAYRLLRKENKALTTTSNSYGGLFHVGSDTVMFKAHVVHKMPCDNIIVRSEDPNRAAVVDWLTWRHELGERVEDAENYSEKLVHACTSVGQIKRLLPDEVLRFVPVELLDFSSVERRSRIPRGFTLELLRENNLVETLALGSLSPEKRRGLTVSVQKKTTLEGAQ